MSRKLNIKGISKKLSAKMKLTLKSVVEQLDETSSAIKKPFKEIIARKLRDNNLLDNNEVTEALKTMRTQSKSNPLRVSQAQELISRTLVVFCCQAIQCLKRALKEVLGEIFNLNE
jgi:hypothetical protein